MFVAMSARTSQRVWRQRALGRALEASTTHPARKENLLSSDKSASNMHSRCFVRPAIHSTNGLVPYTDTGGWIAQRPHQSQAFARSVSAPPKEFCVHLEHCGNDLVARYRLAPTYQ